MEAALKKLIAIALLAACATAPGVAFAAKYRQGPPAVYGPLIDAPVALPYGGGAYPGYGGCSTDEGYGRRGSCDNY